MATVTLRPSGAGDETEIPAQYPTSTYHWDKVDEETSDGDTTRVYNAYTGYASDLYALPDQTLTGTITSVVVYIVCKRSSIFYEGYGKTAIKTGGTVYLGSANLLGISYTTHSTTYNTNPNTGLAWTWAQIDDLQAGVSLYGQFFFSTATCTQVYVIVTYTPGELTQKTIEDTASVEDSLGAKTVFKAIISSTVLADTVSTKFTGVGTGTYTKLLAEGLSLTEGISITATQIYMKTLSEVMEVEDSVSQVIDIKRTLGEVIQLVETVTFWSNVAQLVGDIVATGEEIVKTISKEITDSLSVVDSTVRQIQKYVTDSISLIWDFGWSKIAYVPELTKLSLIDNLSVVATVTVPATTSLVLTDIISVTATALSPVFTRDEIDVRLSTESYLDIALTIEGGGNK